MYHCEECSRPTKIAHGYKTLGRILCQSCCKYHNSGGKIYARPPFGEIAYSEEGLPICHICGKAFHKMLAHVWQVHNMSEKEYKEKFGLDLYKGVASEKTKDKLRVAVRKHYNLVVEKNLLSQGAETRFKEGGTGRTIDKVSPQTMRRLKQTSFIKSKIK